MHLKEGVLIEPPADTLRLTPKQTTTSFLWRSKFFHPICFEHLNLHTTQELPKDIFEAARSSFIDQYHLELMKGHHDQSKSTVSTKNSARVVCTYYCGNSYIMKNK